MRILQRYILIELLRVFVFVLSIMTVLLVFVGVFSQVTDKGLGPVQVLQILPYVVPSLFPFTIPATLLLTVTVVYGRIAGDQEVTAAKAAGINVISLLSPSFIMGAVLAFCSLLLEDQVIPWAVENMDRTVTLAMEDIFLDILRSSQYFVDHNKGLTIAVTRVDGKKLIKPTIQYRSPGQKQPATLCAEEAGIEFDLKNKKIKLHLVQAQMKTSSAGGIALKDDTFEFPLLMDDKKPNPRFMSIHENRTRLGAVTAGLEERKMERDVETALALAVGDFDHLAHPDLHQYELDLVSNKVMMARCNTAIHDRFARSMSCFFFALLGGPFAILHAKKQFLTCFFICFVPILLIYYPVALLMINLSKSSIVSPVWAMWVGNVVLFVIAMFILRKVLKH